MTFLDKLQSHKGGLVQLKTQLYWYDDRDNNPDRICLLLDATGATTTATVVAATAAASEATTAALAAALLLIEGKPQWVWLTEQDIDLLVNDSPTD